VGPALRWVGGAMKKELVLLLLLLLGEAAS